MVVVVVVVEEVVTVQAGMWASGLEQTLDATRNERTSILARPEKNTSNKHAFVAACKVSTEAFNTKQRDNKLFLLVATWRLREPAQFKD